VLIALLLFISKQKNINHKNPSIFGNNDYLQKDGGTDEIGLFAKKKNCGDFLWLEYI